MGLGKSLVAIEICKAIFNKYDAPALVICPKGIRDQWYEMILDQDSNAQILILDHINDFVKYPIIAFDYLICHYEAVIKFNNQLRDIIYSTVVCDEAHRIKNHGTQSRPILRTRAVKLLKAYRKIGLTGTPYDKNPAEIWSLLHWLNPKEFSSYWKFFETHVTYDENYMGWKSNYRLKNPQQFAATIAPYVLGRAKRDVMPELPPLIKTHIPIELSKEQRGLYNKVKNVLNLEVDLGLDEPLLIKNTLAKIAKLHQVASDPINLGSPVPSTKLAWLLEWLDDHPDEPVLIFTKYRNTAQQLAQHTLTDALVIGGSKLSTPLNSAQRIVATIAAMAEGYDLGHIQTAIYVDCDWSSILMSQSMERIDRGNNTESKNIIFLEATNTVDQLVKKALEHKWSTKQIVDQYLSEVQRAIHNASN